MPKEAFEKVWPKIVARAWSDSIFKERLIKDSSSVFAEYGIEVPPGIGVEIHENTGTTLHLIFPERPQGELSEKELADLAAGFSLFQPTSSLLPDG